MANHMINKMHEAVKLMPEVGYDKWRLIWNNAYEVGAEQMRNRCADFTKNTEVNNLPLTDLE